MASIIAASALRIFASAVSRRASIQSINRSAITVDIFAEGPIGFWTEHTRNKWGNQIWFDLLLAVGAAWSLIVPQAKQADMRTPAWLFAIVCTGSIGLLAIVARLNYLRLKESSANKKRPA